MFKHPLPWQDFLAIVGLASMSHTFAHKAGLSAAFQLGLPIAVLAIGAILRSEWIIWNDLKWRFKAVQFKTGTGALDIIVNAKNSIKVTHFVGDGPNRMYIDAMLDERLQHRFRAQFRTPVASLQHHSDGRLQ